MLKPTFIRSEWSLNIDRGFVGCANRRVLAFSIPQSPGILYWNCSFKNRPQATSKHFFTSAGSKKGLSMKMVAWVSGAAVGGELAAPSWVAWQPEVTAVALGYDSTVVIFRTQPEFTRIASLSIQVSLSPSSHPLRVLLSCS